MSVNAAPTNAKQASSAHAARVPAAGRKARTSHPEPVAVLPPRMTRRGVRASAHCKPVCCHVTSSSVARHQRLHRQGNGGPRRQIEPQHTITIITASHIKEWMAGAQGGKAWPLVPTGM